MRYATAGYGAWLLLLGSLIGLGGALFAYFWTGNGIHGSAGALLIVITIALMFLAAAALTWWPAMPRWLHGILLFLILIDILGSGFAAYMLDAWYVVGAMVLALVAYAVLLWPISATSRTASA
jgi:quinoprotein glucose dehydrogenase